MQQTMLQLNKKNQNDLINLVYDVLDENNPFNDLIKTEDIYNKDNLFDDTDSKDIKKVSDSEIPSDDKMAVDGPKKIKIIPKSNSAHLASNSIIKKIKSKDKKEV